MRETNIAIRLKIFIYMTLITFMPQVSSYAQTEGGGTSGADFLLYPPASRVDAMGGVLDGLGNNLEGIFFNPAILSMVTNFKVQFNINPLPNEVTHTQLSLGIPLFGGLAGAGAQILNMGQFTFVDDTGTVQEQLSVYDAAIVLGYSRYLWKTISMGINAKGVYRVLGDYNAFAFGTDVGVAAWFETPHIGQRPKPPTYKQLENEFKREKAGINKEKEKRIKEAAKESLALQKNVADVEKSLADQSDKIAKAIENLEKSLVAQADKIAKAAEDKKEPLLARKAELEANLGTLRERLSMDEPLLAGKAELETNLSTLRDQLVQAQENEKEALAEIEEWYNAEISTARARFDKKLADLDDIESERKRLFVLIDNPEKELVNEMIDSNIDESIVKTREFIADRQGALLEADITFKEKRKARIKEIKKDIDMYQAQIDEQVGPEMQIVNEELEALKTKLEKQNAELEGLESAGIDKEDKEKIAENREKIKEKRVQILEIKKEISARETALDQLQSDPWIKRLVNRIEEKQKELAAIEAEIAVNTDSTTRAIENVTAGAEKDIKNFEALRVSLKKELQKAKLKRDLDLLDANTPQKQEKVQRDYKTKEKKVYMKLLAAMYGNEEKIFQVRLSSARQDAGARRYDSDNELQKSRERLEDDFAFQNRFLSRKITDLKKKMKESGSEDKSELTSAQEELKKKEEEYKKAMQSLENERKLFISEESAKLKARITEIQNQRKRVRLIYLQTDKPYLNTSLGMAMRNLGTNIKFLETGYPFPLSFSGSLGYTLLNVDNHSLKISIMADFPLYDPITVGIGVEYGLFNFAYIRAGYSFGSTERNFSTGFGLRLALGFTEYMVDYAFRPLPDYGLLHSFGVSIAF